MSFVLSADDALWVLVVIVIGVFSILIISAIPNMGSENVESIKNSGIEAIHILIVGAILIISVGGYAVYLKLSQGSKGAV